jgi:hypothetical protein
MKAILNNFLLDIYCWYVATKIVFFITIAMTFRLETEESFLDYVTESIYKSVLKIEDWQ